MSGSESQPDQELRRRKPSSIEKLVSASTLLIETFSDKARDFEDILPQGYVREKHLLGNVRAELLRLRSAIDESVRTLPYSGLEGASADRVTSSVTTALACCISTISPTEEKLERLIETLDNSNSNWSASARDLEEHSNRIHYATSLLEETLPSITKSTLSVNYPEFLSRLKERMLAGDHSRGLATRATGIEEHPGDNESSLARRRRLLGRRVDEVPSEENPSLILPPTESLDNLSPESSSVAPPSDEISVQLSQAPVGILTCWVLISLVLTVVLGSTAIGVYFSVARDQMGDGFTAAAWMVGVGALLLAGPIAHHYPHCKCWKPRDSYIRSCWILIMCGLGFLITSGAIGVTFTVAWNRMGDGFSAASYVVGVGALILVGPVGYHYPHCRCWKKRESFLAPLRADTIDMLQN